MKKILLTFALFALIQTFCDAQEPFRAKLRNDELQLNLNIDLYEESIEVPGLEMFGAQHGYMDGNIYGTWIITSCKMLDAHSATANFSNDAGSETQNVLITLKEDGTYELKHTNSTCMKKVVGKKLVKLPSTMLFKRVGTPAKAAKN